MEFSKADVLVMIVSVTLMLDSVTLTVVVPIIPDFLLNVDDQIEIANRELKAPTYRNKSEKVIQPEAYLLDIDSENGRVGLLLSSKAFVQLVLNPAVGYWTASAGYEIPLFSGTCILLLSLVLFAVGDTYLTLFIARASQGVASALISVTGLCLVADTFNTEPKRSRVMGIVLSSAALGVLLGYPFGGFMYDFAGKAPPFVILSLLVFSLILLQFYYLERNTSDSEDIETSNWSTLLMDRNIFICGGAIGVSTSAMSILEPCLPIWLMGHIKPKKWQLGTAFIPDSLGYTIGTNTFNQLAYKEGRKRVALAALLLVGVSCIMIPLASSMLQLILPHFCLGLGIGAVDAALVPLLASIADYRESPSYGTVYAIQQMAVSLAYAVGPMVGGGLVRTIGFPYLMTLIGVFNVCFCYPLSKMEIPVSNEITALHEIAPVGKYYAVEEYKKFSNEMENGE